MAVLGVSDVESLACLQERATETIACVGVDEDLGRCRAGGVQAVARALRVTFCQLELLGLLQTIGELGDAGDEDVTLANVLADLDHANEARLGSRHLGLLLDLLEGLQRRHLFCVLGHGFFVVVNGVLYNKKSGNRQLALADTVLVFSSCEFPVGLAAGFHRIGDAHVVDAVCAPVAADEKSVTIIVFHENPVDRLGRLKNRIDCNLIDVDEFCVRLL